MPQVPFRARVFGKSVQPKIPIASMPSVKARAMIHSVAVRYSQDWPCALRAEARD